MADEMSQGIYETDHLDSLGSGDATGSAPASVPSGQGSALAISRSDSGLEQVQAERAESGNGAECAQDGSDESGNYGKGEMDGGAEAPESQPGGKGEGIAGKPESQPADGKGEGGSEETAIQAAVASRTPTRGIQANTLAVAVCVGLLVALTMLGSMLNVGDHLMAAHPVLGWVFYALIIALVIVGIVVPVVKVAKRPIFSLYQLRDEKGRAKRRRCRMLADNLIANTNLSDKEIYELEGYLERGDEADDLLIEFFKSRFVPAIDTDTKRAASTAFFIAAVSRSPLISTVTMLSICLDLVRAIVETCGFRPTNVGLARLYVRVMISALIIGGIEDSDLSDLLGQLMGGGAGARVGGAVLGATAEGLVSAFLVFRVGVLTKKWLIAADGPVSMAAIRRTSYREALAMMRTSEFMDTVTDTVKQTTGTVASSVASAVKHKADSVTENVANAVKHTTDSVVDSVSSTVNAATETVTDTFNTATESVASQFNAAKKSVADKVKAFFHPDDHNLLE